MNASRSRCAVSMPACTLNTTALNGSVTSRTPPETSSRGPGGRREGHEGVENLPDAEVEHRGAEDHRRRLTGQEHLLIVLLTARDQQIALLDGGVPVDALTFGRGLGRQEFFGRDGRSTGGTGETDVAAVLDVEQAAEVTGDPDGPVEGRRCQADPRLDFVEQLERRLARAVPLVDHGDDRDAELAAHLEELEGLRFEALGGVDQHHGRVDGGEHAVGVLGEVGVAGGVDEVDDVGDFGVGGGLVIELQRSRTHRDTAGLLHLHPVGDGGAAAGFAVDGTGLGDDTCMQGEGLGERRLTGVGVRDHRECSTPRDLRLELFGLASGGSGLVERCRSGPFERCVDVGGAGRGTHEDLILVARAAPKEWPGQNSRIRGPLFPAVGAGVPTVNGGPGDPSRGDKR